jgi:adenylate cyclase
LRRAQWRSRRRLLLALVAVTAATLGIVTHATGVFHRTELQTIDARYSVRGTNRSLLRNFVVVGVDSQTLSDFATSKRHPADWPFPRRDHARVIDNLVRAGAKHIAVDIQFSQPSPYGTADDYALAAALTKAKHVVLATTAVAPHGSTDIMGGNANLRRFGDARAANAVDLVDSDGSTRRMRYSYQGLETFGTAIATQALGHAVSPSLFGGAGATVPIDYAGPPGTVKYIPYWRVWTGKFPAALVRGKTVLIGASAAILQDRHETPTSASTSDLMSGTEIVANEAATVLNGIPLRDAAGWINVLLIIVLGCSAPLLGLRGWALRALAGGALVGALYALAVQVAFNSGSIIAVIDPEFALIVGIVGTLAVVYLSEAFERQYARNMFARFVPPGVVDEVLSSADDDLRLAGVQRVCTVMFSDLRGFTQFSESEPVERVIAVVNHYLNEMTQAILDAGGTLIAYMGDGIMAVFGAPLEQDDHADRALRAAREMTGPRLAAFNAWLAEQGHPSDLRMGVGLNTGTVMCGNVGADQRVEYTAIGDTTNTASRLEGMTKGGPHMLFVAEATRDALRDVPHDLSFVDELEIRGREAKMRVYSIPDPTDSAPAESTE